MKGHGKVIITNTMIRISMIASFLVFLFPLQNCFNYCDTPLHTFPKILLQPEESRTVHGGVGEKYNKSAKWTFETIPGGNLSIHLNQNSFDLRGKDCINDAGGPSVKMAIYSDGKEVVHTACTNRREKRSFVSSNVVKLFHCRGVQEGSFNFTVNAKIAGNVRLGEDEYVEFMEPRNTPQWIGLAGSSRSISVHLLNIEVAKSKAGNCKRGYVKIYDKTGELLHKICNNGENFETHFEKAYDEVFLNITFNRAAFQMKIQTREQEKPDAIQDFTNTTTSDPNSTSTKSKQGQVRTPSWLYKVVGISLGSFFLLLMISFTTFKFFRNRRRQEFINSSKSVEFHTYTRGMSVTHTDNKPTPDSCSTQQNEKVDQEATKRMPKAVENEPSQHEKNRDIGIKRRILRVNQLKENYIDVEIPTRQGELAAAVKTELCNQQLQERGDYAKQSSPAVTGPSLQAGSTATFNTTRPPFPPPPMAQKFRMRSSPLSELDYVTPAYSSLSNNDLSIFTLKTDLTTSSAEVSLESNVSSSVSAPTDSFLSNLPCSGCEVSNSSRITYSVPKRAAEGTIERSCEGDKEDECFLFPYSNVDVGPNLNLHSETQSSDPERFLGCCNAFSKESGRVWNRFETLARKENDGCRTADDIEEKYLKRCNGREELPVVYDFPKPSLDGTKESFLATKPNYYDTPRPSVPKLLPGETD